MEKKTEPKYGKYGRLKRSSRSRKRKFHGNQITLLLEKQVVEEDQTTVQGEGDVESITTTETFRPLQFLLPCLLQQRKSKLLMYPKRQI